MECQDIYACYKLQKECIEKYKRMQTIVVRILYYLESE